MFGTLPDQPSTNIDFTQSNLNGLSTNSQDKIFDEVFGVSNIEQSSY